MKDPSPSLPVVGRHESVGSSLDKAVQLNKVHSCLKNKVESAPPDSTDDSRRKERAVSFSFPGDSTVEDERDPPNEEARRNVQDDFWDDTEYSVSLDSRKSEEWIEVQLNQRYLCDKMLCGAVGNVDTEIYNDGPLKDLELEPLGDYEALFFKEEEDDYSLSAKSGSTSPARKQMYGNELQENLTDDTDISLNANNMHRVDEDFNDSTDSDSNSTSSRSLVKNQSHEDEALLPFHGTLFGHVNAFLMSRDDTLATTSGTPSQVDRQFPNLQEDAPQSTDCSSLKKQEESMSQIPARTSLDISPHQTLHEASAQSTADGSPLQTLEDSDRGFELPLREHRISMMPKLRYLLPPLPKPKPKPQPEQRAVANPAVPQEGSRSPSQPVSTVSRKLLAFRRSSKAKQQEGGKHRRDEMEPSNQASPRLQPEYNAAQDATSIKGLSRESSQVSDGPPDTKTAWKESPPAATPPLQADNDISEKAREENRDDIEILEESSHTSSRTGFIPETIEKNDGASVQQDGNGSGSEWSLHSICCSMMLMPPVEESDDLSESNRCEENLDEKCSDLQRKCQENEGDDLRSTADLVHSNDDAEDNAIVLSSGSSPSIPSGLCCPAWQKEDEGNEQQSCHEDYGDERRSTVDDHERDTNPSNQSFLSGFWFPNLRKVDIGEEQQPCQENEGHELESTDHVEPSLGKEDDNLSTTGSPPSLLSAFCYPNLHQEDVGDELRSTDPVERPIDQENDTNLSTTRSPPSLLSARGCSNSYKHDEGDKLQSTDPVEPIKDQEDDTNLSTSGSPPSLLSAFCYSHLHKEDEGDELQSTDHVELIKDQDDDTNISTSGPLSLLSGFCHPDSHKQDEGGELSQSKDPVEPIHDQEDDSTFSDKSTPIFQSVFCCPGSQNEDNGDEEQSTPNPVVQSIDDQNGDTNLLDKTYPFFLSGFCCPDSHKDEGPFFDGPTEPSRESGMKSMSPVSIVEQEQDQRVDELRELENANLQECSSVSEKDDAGVVAWHVPIFEPIMASMSSATHCDLSSLQQQGDQGGDTFQWLNPMSVLGCAPVVQNEKDCGSTDREIDPPATSMPTEDRSDLSEPQQEGDERGDRMPWFRHLSVKACVPDVQKEKDCVMTPMPREDDCDLSEPQQVEEKSDMIKWLSRLSMKACVPDTQNEKDCVTMPMPTEDDCDLSEPQQLRQQEGEEQGDMKQWLSHLTSQACNPPSADNQDGGCPEWTMLGCKPNISPWSAVNGDYSPSEPQQDGPPIQESEEIGLVERISQEFSPTIMPSQTVNSDQHSLASAKSRRPAFLPRGCFAPTKKASLVPSSDPTEKANQKYPGADSIDGPRLVDEDDIEMRDVSPPLASPSRRGSIARMSRRRFSQRGGDVSRKVKSMVKMFDRAHLQRQNNLFSITQSKKNVKPRGWKTDKEERKILPCLVSDKALNADIPSTRCNDATTLTPPPPPPSTPTRVLCSDPTEIDRKTGEEAVEPLQVETTLFQSLTRWGRPNMMWQASSQHPENDNGGKVKALVQMYDRSDMTTPPLHRGDYILQAKSVDRQQRRQHQDQQQDQENGQVTSRDMSSHWGSPSTTIRRTKSEGHESLDSEMWSLPMSTVSWFASFRSPTQQKEQEHENKEEDEEHELYKEIAAATPSLSIVDEELVGGLDSETWSLPMSTVTWFASFRSPTQQKEQEHENKEEDDEEHELYKEIAAATPSLSIVDEELVGGLDSETWSLPMSTVSWFASFRSPTQQNEQEHENKEEDDEEHELYKEIAAATPSFSIVDEELVGGGSSRGIIIPSVLPGADPPESWMAMMTRAASVKTTQGQEQQDDEEDAFSISTYAYETLRDLVTSTMPSFDQPPTLPEQDKHLQKEEEEKDMDQVRIVGMSSNVELLSTPALEEEMTQPESSPHQENYVLAPQVSNESPTKRKRRSSRLLGVVGSSSRRLFGRMQKKKQQGVVGR
jgi:hypothetical protein